MPYRKLPDRTSNTPMRQWLRGNLPDEPPSRTSPLTWQLVRRYAAGELPRDLASDAGITVHAVQHRVRYVAVKLGYLPAISDARLLPNGDLADHAVRRDDETGCLLWTGAMAPSDYGPSASLATDEQTPSGTGPRPRTKVPVRRYRWEQAHGPLPRRRYVHAGCGNPACVALEHAVVWTKAGTLTLAEIESLRARKAEETLAEAAKRVGVGPGTVIKARGAGGKRGPMSAELRSWLSKHLPAHRPASVHERDWQFAQHYVAGDSLAAIGMEHGVTRQMVHLRIKRLARRLGCLAGDGDLAP